MRCLPVDILAKITFLGGDDRNGLMGGDRGNGGPSNVNYNWRDNSNDNLAVRLVLASNKIAYKSCFNKFTMPETIGINPTQESRERVTS